MVTFQISSWPDFGIQQIRMAGALETAKEKRTDEMLHSFGCYTKGDRQIDDSIIKQTIGRN